MITKRTLPNKNIVYSLRHGMDTDIGRAIELIKTKAAEEGHTEIIDSRTRGIHTEPTLDQITEIVVKGGK
jgi:hypothetical protein